MSFLQFNYLGLAGDFQAFLPELFLCAGIVLMLFLRVFRAFKGMHMGALALVFVLLALAYSLLQWLNLKGLNGLVLSPNDPTLNPADVIPRFGGLVIFDNFTVYLRLFLYGFTALIVWLTLITGIPDRDDSPDFYCLLLGAAVGMAIMAQANHLLMVFIGVEMASLPSFALAGFLKGRRQSSEAALKYVVYGGGASGVMLYGISLLAGKFGTAYLPDLAAGIVASTDPAHGTPFDPIVILGILLILVGVAFKVSAVPFHFWCPDVFEGASAEVAGFLSVASKGAALALLARVVLLFGGLDGGLDALVLDPSAHIAPPDWNKVARYLVPALAFLAALTA